MSFLKEYDHLQIPMEEILSATNNFDSAMVIGSGGFGRVYKGELSLPEGSITVAFKRLDPRLGRNIEFWKEVMMLSKYKHENLISLMCYCIEGDEMILGYQYASHGSLDRYLSDASLTWTRRLKICVGAARALNYLHDPRGGLQRVIHRDIKSSNILLDENWKAKISDFGLSKIGPRQTFLVSNAFGRQFDPVYLETGTLSKESDVYLETGTLSKETDVYSFGVVLFEILSGRLCCEYNKKGDLTNILVPKWRQCYEENTLDKITFPGLKEQMNPGSLDAFSVIAYQCVRKAREERPTMAEVVKQLEFALRQQDIFEDLGKKVDFETLNKIADGAVTPFSYVSQGMSKEVDWEVDEIIILKEDYDLSQLPDSPRCKNLLKLSIRIPGFTEIPPTFFEHMLLLEELDLSTTNIQSLPSSISSLTFLQKLFLRDCSVLMEIPSEIGMLTKLKLLDCEGSDIMYIPKEIGELNDLEVLRVSLSLYADYFLKTKRVNDSVKIPRNILSKLIKLKELCITTCPEVEWWEEEVKEIQDDLCHLEYLETLKWYLPTKMVLDRFLQIKREGKKIYEDLSNFTLTIGRHPQLTSCLPPDLEKKFENFKNCLKWINAEGNDKDISMIMERAEALVLSRHWRIVRLSDFDLAKLKYCVLAECNEMETLIDVDELSEDVENVRKVGLESIEYLSIHDMEKFQSIWKGPMGKDSLSRLRILALHTCPKLTTIFTINIAQNLSRLTELTVEDCPNVTSLISNESPNIATRPLIPCLEKIFLLDLPELKFIFKGNILEKVDSLLVYNCLKLRYLSVAELPSIRKIRGEKEWWNDLKCDKSRWQNVFEELQEERNLFEQLAEATNSLQHFHNILSHDAKDEKALDHSSLGVSQTKGHTSNFPIGKQKGLSLSQPDDKDEKPLDRFSLGVSATKGHTSNFPFREQEGLSLSQLDAKDEKPLDTSSLGVSETKGHTSNFPIGKQEGLFLSQPDAKDEKPFDRSSLGVSETKGHTSSFPFRKQEGHSLSQPDAKDEKPLHRSSFGVSQTIGQSSNSPVREQEVLSLSQPAAKDQKLLDGFALGVSEIKSDRSNFPFEEQEGVSLSRPGGGMGSSSNNFPGIHRLAAIISLQNQQIKIIQEELDQLQTLGESSLVCQELISSVESSTDALLPVTKGPVDAGWDRWFQRANQSSRNRKRWI